MSGILSNVEWVEFRNDNGGTVPAWGVMRITGVVVVEAGRVVLTCDQPNTYGCQSNCVINGPVDVATGKYGMCQASGNVVALYDTGNTPAFGQMWGPVASSWKLTKLSGGYYSLGAPTNSTLAIGMFRSEPMLSGIGKTDAAVTKGNSGTISVYAGTLGSETDTTYNITAYNRFADVAISKWVRWAWNSGSQGFDLVSAEC